MPKLQQDLPDVPQAGLAGPVGGVRDTSAEAGLVGNLAGLGQAEMEARAKAQAKRELESSQQFMGILQTTGQEFALRSKKIQADSKGALTYEQAADQALSEIQKSPTAFITATTGRSDMTKEEQEQFLGSTYFKGLAQSLSQGNKTETAVMIAAERQVKALIARRPDLADEIRAMAAREINFDPAGEYKATVSRFQNQKEERELTPIEKELQNAQSAVMSDSRIPDTQKAFRIQERKDAILDNYYRSQRVEEIKQRTEMGTWDYTQAENASLTEFTQNLIPDFGKALLQTVSASGLQIEGDGALSPNMKRDLEFQLSGLENYQFRQMQQLAAMSNRPFDAAQARDKIGQSTKQLRDFIESRDAGKQLQAYNELLKSKNENLSYNHFGQVLAYREAFGDQYVDFIKWMQDAPAGQKWAADNKILEFTGMRTGAAKATVDSIGASMRAFSEAANLGAGDVVSGNMKPEDLPQPPKEGAKPFMGAFRGGMPVDDKTFRGVVVDAIANAPSGQAGKVVSDHVRNLKEPLPEASRNYLSGLEESVLSQSSVRQQLDEALSSAVMGVPTVSTDPAYLSKIDKVYVDNDGSLTVEFYDNLNRKSIRKGVASKAYANSMDITLSLAGVGKDKTGISSGSKTEVINKVNAELAKALEELRINATMQESDASPTPAFKVGDQVFPTKHPMVKNDDGSVSNVKLASSEYDGREVVYPTMVDGKQYSEKEAFEIAKRNGLKNYPNFATPEEATAFAERYHGNIDENGRFKGE